MADIAGDVAVNPDAQAAVTDFLDYTEYLPADLIRSLTLIRGLDETYLQNSYAVHDLTKLYGSLSELPAPSKPNAQRLRLDISRNLDRALNARESAYAEACRLFDLTDRHENRLKSIISKLHALPKPPSRDPTPQPQSSASAKRARGGRKLENGIPTTRLTLKPPKGPSISLLSRPKHRRVTVPGEVLPPYDPDEPIASTEVSDWESEHATSPVRPIIKLKTPKLPKAVIEPSERKPRETATYRKPTPPPEDAELGSKYRPWTRLTEYEMYKLRKKMKKNHTWEPSEVMIRRELAEKGRGWENYYKAKTEAQANGITFLDLDNAEKSQDNTIDTVNTPKTTSVSTATPAAIATKGKPARKLEAKKEKEKEEPVPNKAALAAQEAELAARRLGDIGSAFKNLFSPLSNALASLNRSASTPTASVPNPAPNNAGKKAPIGKSSRKRKLDEASISESPSAEPETQKKRQKVAVSAPAPAPAPMPTPKLPANTTSEPPSAGTIKIPLKLNVNPQPAPSSVASNPTSPAKAVNTQRTSVAPKTEASSPAPSRPPSRRSPTISVEPTAPTTRASRRTSMTPAASGRKTPVVETTPKTTQTAASRRSKRDAPGTVTQSSQDGGAAVSISQRKSRPSKQNKVVQAQKPVTSDAPVAQIRIDVDGNQEIVDPDEQRYCVCGDVSWGEMICCELDEKCEFGVWFHMECVHLVELPPRTVKWYCPGDRKKHHKGENSNGLVGRGIK